MMDFKIILSFLIRLLAGLSVLYVIIASIYMATVIVVAMLQDRNVEWKEILVKAGLFVLYPTLLTNFPIAVMIALIAVLNSLSGYVPEMMAAIDGITSQIANYVETGEVGEGAAPTVDANTGGGLGWYDVDINGTIIATSAPDYIPTETATPEPTNEYGLPEATVTAITVQLTQQATTLPPTPTLAPTATKAPTATPVPTIDLATWNNLTPLPPPPTPKVTPVN